MFGSTWGAQQQNQQQQPPNTNVFGQPTTSAFGTNNAFTGSTSAFGQPQQQQPQPQVNPMFGNITTTPSTNPGTTGAFGAFNTANTGNTQGAFGVKPAAGFSAFNAGTSAFGGGTTSAFGQPANTPAAATTSVFGQPANTAGTSAFGNAGTSVFGGSKFGTNPTETNPTVTTGTSNPPYNSTAEKDANTTLQYQSISAMPAYKGYTFEELRVQDYAQGRKTAASSGAFGQTSTFGTTQPATTGIFGAQPAQQPTSSVFGGTTNNANSTYGTFGTNAAQPTAPTSVFGGTSAFGQQPQQQPQQQSTFGTTGVFGQQQQPQQPQSSAFGGGAFGTTANKPAFSAFGTGGTGAFGTTPSAFGNAQQQQQQQPAQNQGLFGAQPTNTNTSAFGAFGTTANKPSVFGTPTTQPTTSVFGGGAFGANPQQQQNQQGQQNPPNPLFGGSNLFANNTQQQGQNQQQQPNSLFGSTPAPSAFGTQNTGASIFGNPQGQQQQQQQQQDQSNPFGNLFNKAPQPAAPLFGQNQQNQTQPQQNPLFNAFNQSTQQNPLFGGNKPVAPLVGNSVSGNNMSIGMFGASASAPGAQGTLTASISQPIGENLPIFQMLPPGPRIVDLENSPKKKSGFFVDVPTRSPIPRVQLGYTPANSKLRGFGGSTSLSTSIPGNPFNPNVSFTSGKPNAISLHKSSDTRSASIGPDFLGRSGSPALGSGGRHSVKKVILDKKVEPSELFVKTGSPGALRSGKVTFSPALSVASREKDAASFSAPPNQNQYMESPTPAARTQRSPNRFTAQNTKEVPATEAEEGTSTELGEGDYWLKPDLPTLKKVGYDQLSSFEGLVVGRKGYGEIHFLKPVDLTGLPKLGALLGEVVRFDDKECSVYPDSEEVDKPPPGSGLNVEARLSLEKCWAVDKATREPIREENHPAAAKHLKRLKNMKDTQFISFDMKTGTWTFTVDHF